MEGEDCGERQAKDPYTTALHSAVVWPYRECSSKVYTNRSVVAASALLPQLIITVLTPCVVADLAADWEVANPLQHPKM